jgi:hypothetical protein
MNLHALAGPVVALVNPPVTAQYLKSTGSVTADDGKRTPSFAAPVDLQAQVQPLTGDDLKQMSGVNLQGERRAMYLTGDVKAIARPDGRGADLLTLLDGSAWLVCVSLEDWNLTAGWVKVGCVRQMP